MTRVIRQWQALAFGHIRGLAVVLLSLCGVSAAFSQRGAANLSEAEVEAVRDSAMVPGERVGVFLKIIETRVDRIQRVLADARAQGRAEDIHDNMDQISGIVSELEDNLDEYAPAHKDLRKVLPKLISATDRWKSILKQPPENSRYKVTRQLALEAVDDLKDVSVKLLPEQQSWFKEHPPSKEHAVDAPEERR